MDTFNKVCYYISIFVVILGVVMTAMSLIVIIPDISTASLMVPGAFLILTLVGLFFMFFYRKRVKG